jgi:predicted RNA-binding protein YlxR (DUF448 family)
MCVACRESQDKKTLIRIVRTPEGVFVDPSGRLPGRGAYLHADQSCWEQGVNKSLEKALKVTLSDADRERLTLFQESLSDDDPSGSEND